MIPILSRIPWRLVGLAAIAAGAFLTGWKAQDWRRDSMELVALEAAERAGERATKAAVAQIGKLAPKFTTIYRPMEKEFRSEVRYASADCSHTPATWGLLERAYQAAGGEPFGDSTGLPASPATD